MHDDGRRYRTGALPVVPIIAAGTEREERAEKRHSEPRTGGAIRRAMAWKVREQVGDDAHRGPFVKGQAIDRGAVAAPATPN
jgi:hypothetical protein